MSWREGVLLSIIVHLIFVIVGLTAPNWLADLNLDAVRRASRSHRSRRAEDPIRLRAAEARSQGAEAAASRGTVRHGSTGSHARATARTAEPAAVLARQHDRARRALSAAKSREDRGRTPDPLPAQQTPTPPQPPQTAERPDCVCPRRNRRCRCRRRSRPHRAVAHSAAPRHRAVRSATRCGTSQRYVQRDQFENAQGGGAFGPAIQFDTKGVEFGPWIRRFIAQVKRNWLIPYAAMSMKGHVVVTFNVHKDGTITDLQVVGAVAGRRVQQRRVRRAGLVESRPRRCRRNTRPTRRSSPSRSSTTKNRSEPVAADRAGPPRRAVSRSSCSTDSVR